MSKLDKGSTAKFIGQLTLQLQRNSIILMFISTVAIKVIETSKLNDNPKLLELSLTEIKVL
jgi:hypothetical protein